MELFEFLKNNSNQLLIDLSDFKFISNDHIRYEKGKDVSGHNYDCWRGVRVQSNISGNEGYTVTMYNLTNKHPLWGNNIQMAPKQMKLVEQTNTKIQLRGYGNDNLGNTFSNYGLTIHLKNKEVQKITLHLYERSIDIVYFNKNTEDKLQTNNPILMKVFRSNLNVNHFPLLSFAFSKGLVPRPVKNELFTNINPRNNTIELIFKDSYFFAFLDAWNEATENGGRATNSSESELMLWRVLMKIIENLVRDEADQLCIEMDVSDIEPYV